MTAMATMRTGLNRRSADSWRECPHFDSGTGLACCVNCSMPAKWLTAAYPGPVGAGKFASNQAFRLEAAWQLD